MSIESFPIREGLVDTHESAEQLDSTRRNTQNRVAEIFDSSNLPKYPAEPHQQVLFSGILYSLCREHEVPYCQDPKQTMAQLLKKVPLSTLLDRLVF
jgi:hypothetical protein